MDPRRFPPLQDKLKKNIELLKFHGADLRSRKPLAIFDLIKAIALARSATTWFGLPLLVMTAIAGLLVHRQSASRIGKPRKASTPLARLAALTDWVPSSVIRKRQRKLIADEAAEIAKFESEGRMRLAQWRRAWTWIYWCGYLISGPFSAAMRLFGKPT